ncbi:MAG: hypothetical protein JXA77_18495 [Bacteroidales bacterium]|nr:hypothetical protein [Bacteroidales bacterium]MBN2818176.1 hypothetical protein [Bacteroidales bacterium]
MKKFLKKILVGNGVSPSEVCLQSFNGNFADAVNVEWFSKKGYYEVVFYQNNLEHIAAFSLNGVLLEYRQNLSVEYLPEVIKNIALSKGEIMNSVLKNKGNMLEYELIIRDKFLKRQLILLTDMGEIKEEKAL